MPSSVSSSFIGKETEKSENKPPKSSEFLAKLEQKRKSYQLKLCFERERNIKQLGKETHVIL